MKGPLVRILRILAIATLIAAAVFVWMRRSAAKGGLELAGSIEARLVEVGSLVGGLVSEVRIEEGSGVSAGQVLVVLEADREAE